MQKIFLSGWLLLSFAGLCGVEINRPGYRIQISEQTGALTAIRDNAGNLIAAADGAWSTDTNINAATLLKTGGTLRRLPTDSPDTMQFEFVGKDQKQRVKLTYRFHDDSFDVIPEVVELPVKINRFYAPSAIRFDAAAVNRVIAPQSGLRGFGFALTKKFFLPHPEAESPLGRQIIGDSAYLAMFGKTPVMKPNLAELTPLKPTGAGQKIYPPEFIKEMETWKMRINRAGRPGQNTTVLIDSADGAVISGANLGGKGLLMRFTGRTGGATAVDDIPRLTRLITRTIDGMDATDPELMAGRTVALIKIKGAPELGEWTAVSANEWDRQLRNLDAVKSGGNSYTILTDGEAVEKALAQPQKYLIFNPYGSILPFGREDWQPAIAAIKKFVQNGGVWWEVGGYPWFYQYRPEIYSSYNIDYPAGVSDFFFLDGNRGKLAIFGVQPLPQQPYAVGEKTPSRLLIPANLSFRGAAFGGEFRHCWLKPVFAGKTAAYPPLRFLFGKDTQTAIAAYRDSLEYPLTLTQKVPGGKLEQLKKSLFIRLWGSSSREQTAMLDKLPSNSIVHIHEYLLGGRDRLMPDHFPPNADWGGEQGLKNLIRAIHERGMLFCPYTNNSFWSINPQGPTFAAFGDGALIVHPESGKVLESYSGFQGYPVCPWHPKVLEAAQKVRDGFITDYPADLLFQDQVGARGNEPDVNPAAPAPEAMLAGLYSLTHADALHIPVATEDGNDRTAAFETMHCGMTWGTISEYGLRGKRHARYLFRPGDWEFFPLFSYIAHDRVLITPHNLGHFITDERKLAEALAFGVGLNLGVNEAFLSIPAKVEWMNFLALLQMELVSRYAGEPLLDFTYPLSRTPGTGNQVIYARYPRVTLYVNIGDTPAEVTVGTEKITLPPFGFRADGKDLAIRTEIDPAGNRRYLIRCGDRQTTYGVSPKITGAPAAIPAEFAGKPPVQWHRSRKILVPCYDHAPSWRVRLTGPDFVKMLQNSQILRQNDFEIVPVKSVGQFESELARQPFAVINPGGKTLCIRDESAMDATIAAISRYIADGGIWIETGASPFFQIAYPKNGQWETKNVGARNQAKMGMWLSNHLYEEPPNPVTVTADGKKMLPESRTKALANLQAGTQRAFDGMPDAIVLVSGGANGQEGVFEGYRGSGWGYLWRLSGTDASYDLAENTVVGILEHLAVTPWEAPVRNPYKVLQTTNNRKSQK